MVDKLAFAAASWGVLMAISPLLQIRRMLARRSSADVSLAYLSRPPDRLPALDRVWHRAHERRDDRPNTVAFLVGAITMAVAWLLRHGARGAD